MDLQWHFGSRFKELAISSHQDLSRTKGMVQDISYITTRAWNVLNLFLKPEIKSGRCLFTKKLGCGRIWPLHGGNGTDWRITRMEIWARLPTSPKLCLRCANRITHLLSHLHGLAAVWVSRNLESLRFLSLPSGRKNFQLQILLECIKMELLMMRNYPCVVISNQVGIKCRVLMQGE